MTPALETRNLKKNFGGFVATNDVSLTVAQGARHALIGPNGAGKTTIINLLTGVLPPMPRSALASRHRRPTNRARADFSVQDCPERRAPCPAA